MHKWSGRPPALLCFAGLRNGNNSDIFCTVEKTEFQFREDRRNLEKQNAIALHSFLYIPLHCMKLTTNVLSLYILLLATLPCADKPGWCIFDVESTVGVEVHAGGSDDHENECSDKCSPLCACSCCQITVRTPAKINLDIPPPTIPFSDPSSLGSLLEDLTALNDIWQPPKSMV